MAKSPREAFDVGVLAFRALELPRETLHAVQFSEDAFVCSFGSAERFWNEAGRDGGKWIERLQEKLQKDPRNAVNALLGETIVGQVVLGSSETAAQAGHVNLYYLVPGFRGRGLGRQLDAYALAVWRDQGFTTATLNVSPTNLPAVRFYHRIGWKPLGPFADAPHVDSMERAL